MAPMRMPSKGTPGASDLLSRVSGVRMFHQAIGWERTSKYSNRGVVSSVKMEAGRVEKKRTKEQNDRQRSC